MENQMRPFFICGTQRELYYTCSVYERVHTYIMRTYLWESIHAYNEYVNIYGRQAHFASSLTY